VVVVGAIVVVVVDVVDVELNAAELPALATVDDVVDDFTVVVVEDEVAGPTMFGHATDSRPTAGGGASSGHGIGAAVVVVVPEELAAVVLVVEAGVVVVVVVEVEVVEVLVDVVEVLDTEHAVGRAMLGSNCATAKFLPVPSDVWV